ncbi:MULTISPECIES: MFS transporter [Comamonas]|jgi:Na+/melibiose symporter-like transporter|uniref:MFS transporter n=1 Tax=Comamonas TaxID=283 RepID=UPI0012CF1696|nr:MULTISPECIES: MFS transporter [Comamonas]MDR3066857.1 MFS transporter [Comamonas sp.]MEB5967078.1 MFS transporter [Comamonas testosteroni]MPS92594.1 MFS transporter [Comamonas sp.]
MDPHPAHPHTLPWRTGLAYGALAAPLAFASLPLYVNLPYHYASVAGAPLAGLGAVLLATRAFDALVDPAIGRWVDRLLSRGVICTAGAAILASLLMALGFGALWHPPFDAQNSAGLLGWLAFSLLVCTLAYSILVILHQAWGTRWGGDPAWRARVTAWREGASLSGVLLASMLPTWLGLDATTAFLALGLALGLAGLLRLKVPVAPQQPAAVPLPSPWANAGFRRLLAIFMLNGVAAAIPATLLPFFVADRLQASALQPALLLCFFGAAALGLPLWVKAVSHWGLAPSWRIGMLTSVLAFGFTPWLGEGDGMAFAVICLASGLALGADLALPGALLTGVIHESGDGGRSEGRYLGWWTCATKLNLALAAGLALPLLSAAGYRSGASEPAGLQALAWAYGGLPCLLKLAAAALLWRAERLHSSWRHT